MAKQVIAFESEDGHRFDTMEEAEARDEWVKFVDELDKLNCMSEETDTAELAEWILENFERRKK